MGFVKEVKKVVKLSRLIEGKGRGERMIQAYRGEWRVAGIKREISRYRTVAPRESDPPRMIFALPFRDMVVDTRNPI